MNVMILAFGNLFYKLGKYYRMFVKDSLYAPDNCAVEGRWYGWQMIIIFLFVLVLLLYLDREGLPRLVDFNSVASLN